MTKWTISVEVTDNWIADGFSLNSPEAQRVIAEKIKELLPYAYPQEMIVKVISSPTAREIKEAVKRYEQDIR